MAALATPERAAAAGTGPPRVGFGCRGRVVPGHPGAGGGPNGPGDPVAEGVRAGPQRTWRSRRCGRGGSGNPGAGAAGPRHLSFGHPGAGVRLKRCRLHLRTRPTATPARRACRWTASRHEEEGMQQRCMTKCHCRLQQRTARLRAASRLLERGRRLNWNKTPCLER